MNKNLIAILTLASASAMFGAQGTTPAKPAAPATTSAASTAAKPAVAKKHGIFHKKHAKKAVTPAAKSTASVVTPVKPAAK